MSARLAGEQGNFVAGFGWAIAITRVTDWPAGAALYLAQSVVRNLCGFTMVRRVVLPSALRRALPLYSNEVILMLHATTTAVAFTATVPAC